jgi:uncharacterized protein (TIGR02391 family)
MGDIERHFEPGQIEAISHILGDTVIGLKGTEIEYMLNSIGIKDVSPEITKWKRLYNAFITAHNEIGHDNFIIRFILRALEPSRFLGQSDRYNSIISDLNKVLSFQGLCFMEDGRIHSTKVSHTLSEAEQRATDLKNICRDRGFHSELIKYCESELLENNYFHAVFEAVKGISSFIRARTNLTADGTDLFDVVFGIQNPILLINTLQNDSEKSEQKGFCNLLKGLFGTFRNPLAHSAKIEWPMDKQDALDLFAIASYCYRRIEKANVNHP